LALGATGGRILSTAVAPSWDQIGKLAAIVVLRTALNTSRARKSAIPNTRVRNGGRIGPDRSVPISSVRLAAVQIARVNADAAAVVFYLAVFTHQFPTVSSACRTR
jgi:hypothetical protein